MSSKPQVIDVSFLLERYEVFLIDAFGVLVNTEGALPGAATFLEHLHKIEKPFYLVSNGSQYSPDENEIRYANKGLHIPKERIISSASMIAPWIEKNNFKGKNFLVLGPEKTKNRIREAGGVLCKDDENRPDILVIGDQTGYDLLEGIDHMISIVFQSIDRGQPLPVVVPNPDVIYPKASQSYGITAGALALILQESVRLRYPDCPFEITYLGKPYSHLFEEARKREGSKTMVMIGDQLETDIRGANTFGIDSVLIGTGVSELSKIKFKDRDTTPTYVLKDLIFS